MRRVSSGLFLLLIFPAATVAAGQQTRIDPAKEADIRKLLQVTGMTEVVQRQMSQTAENIKPLLERALPPGERRREIAEAFSQRFLARATSESLLQHMMPIYDKYFSDQDIKAVLRFYASPEGQHLLKVMPQVIGECGIAGREWGQQIGRQVIEELAQKYPELRQKP